MESDPTIAEIGATECDQLKSVIDRLLVDVPATVLPDLPAEVTTGMLAVPRATHRVDIFQKHGLEIEVGFLHIRLQSGKLEKQTHTVEVSHPPRVITQDRIVVPIETFEVVTQTMVDETGEPQKTPYYKNELQIYDADGVRVETEEFQNFIEQMRTATTTGSIDDEEAAGRALAEFIDTQDAIDRVEAAVGNRSFTQNRFRRIMNILGDLTPADRIED